VTIGRRSPAIAASCDDLRRRDRPQGGIDAGAPASLHEHPGYLDALVDLHPEPLCGLRVRPHHRVVSGERTRRVVRGAEDGELPAAGEIDERADLECAVGREDLGANTERAVQRGLLPFDLQRVLGVTQIDLALGREQDVHVEALRQRPVHRQARGVQGHGLGSVVVGPQHLRVPPAGAAPQVGALEHRDLPDPVVGGEVVGEREPVHAAADHHDVVGRFEVVRSEQLSAAQQAAHRGTSSRRRRRWASNEAGTKTVRTSSSAKTRAGTPATAPWR
jgi:hypothetical protein